MQDTKTCPCGNDDPTYRHSDRHRGYYACDDCGRDLVVDIYA